MEFGIHKGRKKVKVVRSSMMNRQRGQMRCFTTNPHLCWKIWTVFGMGLLLFATNDYLVVENVLSTEGTLVFASMLSSRPRRADGSNDESTTATTSTTAATTTAPDIEAEQSSTTMPRRTTLILENTGDSLRDSLKGHLVANDPLESSRRQQSKFESHKNLLETSFDQSMRYDVDLFEYGANIVNDDWAYVHIFKNGGTTIEVQTGHDHTSLRDPAVQQRQWFTFVRDPIDHFLSGWAECAHRQHTEGKPITKHQSNTSLWALLAPPSNTTTTTTTVSIQKLYDQRVNAWIDAVTALARPNIPPSCEIHSFPQVNALLDGQGHLSPQLVVVADLKELPAVLETVIGFPYNSALGSGRNASANVYLQTYFPKRPQWLSTQTLQRLCDFLAMDYFLLDFDRPSSCTTSTTDTASTTTTTHSKPPAGSNGGEEDDSMEEFDRELSTKTTNARPSSLIRSRRQQLSFQQKKGSLVDIFPRPRRFRANGYDWAGNILTEDWAYLHIWKNGGTTIAAQTNNSHVPLQDRQFRARRRWLTLVRDPIEHFLSGWSECGNRQHQGRRNKHQKQHQYSDRTITVQDSDIPIPDELLNLDYDTRIQQWLTNTQKFARAGHGFTCEIHSFPQVNSLLTSSGTVWPKLEFVGDLQELSAVLQDIAGFDYNSDIETGRNATTDDFLQRYYPKRIDLLSNATVIKLCDFLAIDYYLLDYPLPDACGDMPPSGYTQNWTTTVVRGHNRRRPATFSKEEVGGEVVATSKLQKQKLQALHQAARRQQLSEVSKSRPPGSLTRTILEAVK